MRFPHPKGNIPIRMRQRGQPGITIDRSTDTVSIFHCDWQNSTWASGWKCPYTDPFLWRQATWQASLGTGNLPPVQADACDDPSICWYWCHRRLWARAACLLAGKRVSRDLVLGSGGGQVANFLVCTMLIIVYNLDHLVIMLRYWSRSYWSQQSCCRMLLLSPSMAFGEAGIFHKIPSNVSSL